MTAGSSATLPYGHNSHVERLILDCLLARCRRKAEALNKAEAALRLVATDSEYGYYLLAAARREPIVNDLASAMDLIHEAGSHLPQPSLRTTIEQSLTAGYVHLAEGDATNAAGYYLQAHLLMCALGIRAPHHLWRELLGDTATLLRAMTSTEAI